MYIYTYIYTHIYIYIYICIRVYTHRSLTIIGPVVFYTIGAHGFVHMRYLEPFGENTRKLFNISRVL